MILASLRHGLSNVLTFRGRTTRALFWPYASMLFGAAMVAWAMAFIPEVLGVMTRMQRFAAEHPDQATVTHGPGSYSIQIEGNHPELAPDFAHLMTWLGVIVAVLAALIAAAVVRRLHDTDRTGWWGLPPLVLLVTGLVGMRYLFASFGAAAEPELGLFFAMFANNLVYLATLGVLILHLSRSGSVGVNRFGSAP
jgi:uncharacterized membrane protein YhaH (DUF805 family)